MNYCRSSFIHPVDYKSGCLLKQQTGQDIGNWHSFGEYFAEMLIFIVRIQFNVVENLSQLRFAHTQKLVRLQIAGEHLLRQTDQIYLIFCKNSLL